MKVPTNEEIKAAYDAFFVDAHDPDLARQMGDMASSNEMLRWQVKQLAAGYDCKRHGAIRKKLGDRRFMESVIASAVMYGVTRGIYIGQDRQREKLQ